MTGTTFTNSVKWAGKVVRNSLFSRCVIKQEKNLCSLVPIPLSDVEKGPVSLFIYLGFYVAFNTVRSYHDG